MKSEEKLGLFLNGWSLRTSSFKLERSLFCIEQCAQCQHVAGPLRKLLKTYLLLSAQETVINWSGWSSVRGSFGEELSGDTEAQLG